MSMNSWLLVVFAAVIGWYNGYMSITNTLFFLSFGVMQLVEYFLWSYPTLNAQFSALGLGVVLTQPLFSILQLPTLQQMAPYLGGYAAFLATTVYTLMNPTQYNLKMESVVARNGHLRWKWLPTNSPTFFILYMLLLLVPLAVIRWYIPLVGAIATLLFSLYTYWHDDTWGSMWCWFASLFSLWIIGCSVLRTGTCSI